MVFSGKDIQYLVVKYALEETKKSAIYIFDTQTNEVVLKETIISQIQGDLFCCT
jgi:hypothetical protein